MTISTKKICDHIDSNIERWIFSGDHISGNHMNVPADELLKRIGRYENGRMINRSSTFVDQNGGDDIIKGIVKDVKSRAGVIARWLAYSDNDLLGLYFDRLPDGVTGYTCNIYEKEIKTTGKYYVLLCKNEQLPFYMLNAYPIS